MVVCIFLIRILERKIYFDTFSQWISQIIKKPLVTYIRTQKMIRASELLTLSSMRLKEIAFVCHFSSLMDFSRSFKRYAGMSPGKYRELKKQSK